MGPSVARWHCDRCRQTIGDGLGFVAVDFRALASAQHGGSTARWRIRHDHCATDGDGSSYWIAVEELRDAAELIRWTAHLLRKPWLRLTDWDLVLERAHEDLNRGTRKRAAAA